MNVYFLYLIIFALGVLTGCFAMYAATRKRIDELEDLVYSLQVSNQAIQSMADYVVDKASAK